MPNLRQLLLGFGLALTFQAVGASPLPAPPEDTIPPPITLDLTHDLNGRQEIIRDRNGNPTVYHYDNRGNLTATRYPDATPESDEDNPRSRSEYDAAGRQTAVIDENGNRTEYEYDKAGRNTLVRDALGKETQYQYDANGNRIAVIDALGRRTRYFYDAAGRLTETLHPDTTPGDDSDNPRTATEYDALGRKRTVTDENGLTTHYEYDAQSRLTAVVDTLGQRTEYRYDPAGNKILQRDANGHETTWTHDALGRQTARILPEGQTETFQYDPLSGNLSVHTDFNGQATRYHYDDNHREVLRSHLQDGASVATTYTATGQIDTLTDEHGVTGHHYDARDRLVRITYPTSQTVEYGYDARGGRTWVEADGHRIDYTYDALGRLETVSDDGGLTATRYDYLPTGHLHTINRPNGIQTRYLYDERTRLTEQQDTDGEARLLQQLVYTLDPAGHRTHLDELNGRTSTWEYDKLYRLTAEQILDPVHGDQSTQWTYDPVGNRQTQTVQSALENGVTSYLYDANDRLLSHTGPQGTTTYRYDDNGNTIAKTVNGLPTNYGYDPQNRLIQADTPEGVAEYGYDANGIRIKSSHNGTVTHYLIDPNQAYAQVLGEYDQSFNEQAFYTYGHDLLSRSGGGERRHYLYDALGSTRALSDDSGVITDTYAYEAFGELTGQIGVSDNDYLFTGEQLAPELGLYYLRARYMDPGVGRFSRLDKWLGDNTYPATLNKYSYANSSPINGVDPSGHMTLHSISTAFAGAINLYDFGSTAYAIYGHYVANPFDESSTDTPSVWDALLISSFISGAHEAIVKIGDFKGLDYSHLGGRTPQAHHIIPQYMCGSARQKLVSMSVPDHTKLHSQLDLLATIYKRSSGRLAKLAKYHKKRADQDKDLLKKIGRKKMGRRAIASGLNTFYYFFDWMRVGIKTPGHWDTIGDGFGPESESFIDGSRHRSCG